MRGCVAAFLLTCMPVTAFAQEAPARVPVVAAGMEWTMDGDSCAITTDVERSAKFSTLGFGFDIYSRNPDRMYILMHEPQAELPAAVTLLANGQEPVALEVDTRGSGTTNVVAMEFEPGENAMFDKLVAGETQLLFAVYEMISLSPYGLAELAEQRWPCVERRFAADGVPEDYVDGVVKGPVASRPPSELFSSEDMPRSATIQRNSGGVRAILLINEEGGVDRCIIDESSENDDLDRRTCDVFVNRFRADPARDAAGNAVKGAFYAPRVRWQNFKPWE